jgi:hypothetical protein
MSKRARHMRKTHRAKRIRAELKDLTICYPHIAPFLLKKMAVWRARARKAGWVSFGWVIQIGVKSRLHEEDAIGQPVEAVHLDHISIIDEED